MCHLKAAVVRAAASLVCTLALLSTALARAEQGQPQSFDISPQSLATALSEFAKQSQQEILFAPDVVSKRMTSGVRGLLEPLAALQMLLQDTGLAFTTTPGGAILVGPPGRTSGGASRTRLAQSEEPGANAEESVQQRESAKRESGDGRIEIEEIVVTGTHIRGAAPSGSELIVIDRDYINKSGYATIQDIVRTLPQNFSGGVNEKLGTTDPSAVNINYGSAVNLRGLGASATLVLVNGRRTVPGGFAGSFVDVSNIPSSAIERVEVLTDGASALYGSDAVGGVVNFILRKDYDGAETRARYGTLDGDADEIQAAQLFGKSWDSGNALAGYQYYKRDALALTDRPFSADTDQRSRGGDNFSSLNSNPGNVFALSGETFAIPSGQNGTSLTVDDLLPGVVNFYNQAQRNDLLPEQEAHSVFLNLSQDWGKRVHLFAEGRYNVRDTTSLAGGFGTTLFVDSSNPFFVDFFGDRFVLVGYEFLDDLGPSVSQGESESYSAVLGAAVDLSDTWQLALTGLYAEEKNRNTTAGINFTALDQALMDPNPATAFNPFGDGSNTNPATLETIRTMNHFRADTDLLDIDIKLDGPLFALAGGAARLAIGANRREEDFNSLTREVGMLDFSRGRSRNVSAVFAEFALPIISPDNAVPGIRRLDLSLAGRYDDYSDFGDTVNPKFGLTWAPVESLKIRGTWGTSFKAPRLVELEESPATNAAVMLPVADPRLPSGRSFALLLFGNNQNLQEETATTWTAGLNFTPAAISGLDVSLTYYDIDYEDRIARPGPFQLLTILLEEEQWADVIARNPSPAEVAAICTSPIYRGAPCNFLPFPAAIIDVRLRNLAITRLRGLDLDVAQTFDTARGAFSLGLIGSYILSFEQAGSEAAPLVDRVDTLNNPLALRLRGTLAWNLGAWGAALTVNYADSYRDTQSRPNRSVDAWTTADVQTSYRIGANGWLDNLVFALSAVNVFDEAPPFANQTVGFDPTNANAYGRLLSLQITKEWQ